MCLFKRFFVVVVLFVVGFFLIRIMAKFNVSKCEQFPILSFSILIQFRCVFIFRSLRLAWVCKFFFLCFLVHLVYILNWEINQKTKKKNKYTHCFVLKRAKNMKYTESDRNETHVSDSYTHFKNWKFSEQK